MMMTLSRKDSKHRNLLHFMPNSLHRSIYLNIHCELMTKDTVFLPQVRYALILFFISPIFETNFTLELLKNTHAS
jgi:hypothetical protein